MACPKCMSVLIDSNGSEHRCAHCGHRWRGRGSSRRTAAIAYLVVTCPHCDSEKTEIYRTARPKRYHRCRDCGRTFVSVEVGQVDAAQGAASRTHLLGVLPDREQEQAKGKHL